jgi:polyisoprenoid-binding protein YceI
MKISLLILLLCPFTSWGQKIVSNKSTVTFFSDGVIEDITATTSKTTGIIDLSKKEFAFSLPIREFEFEKSLMKEHFNEKYMESEKYPKATFLGTIQNFSDAAETQEVNAVGKLTIHGVSKDVEIPARMRKSGNGFLVNAKFMVKLADYDIEIPQLLFQNIAEEVEVTVDFNFVPK